MPNMEKTLKGLECCKKLSAEDPFSGCDNCPYNEVSVAVEDCRSVLCTNALELLKEQANAYNYLQKQFFEVQDQLLAKPEIIRCKHCKHGILFDSTDDRETQYDCEFSGIHTENWFCADGERKDEE